MFSEIYYIRDPETGLYWDGNVPGQFTSNVDQFWLSEAAARAAYRHYLIYHASAKNPKRSIDLILDKHAGTWKLTETMRLSKETHPRAYLRARFKREFDAALLYVYDKARDPLAVKYWCKLQDAPLTAAAEAANPELVEMVQRSVTFRTYPWIGLYDHIDYTFLKLTTVIIKTIVSEDYLR